MFELWMRPWLKTKAGREYLFGFHDLIDLYDSAAESGLYDYVGLENLAGDLNEQARQRRMRSRGKGPGQQQWSQEEMR